MGLRDQEASTRSDNAVPRNATPGWAGGHSVTCGTCSAAEPQRTRYFTVCGDAPARDLLYQCIDRLPGHFTFRSPICKIRRLKRVAGSAIHPGGPSGIFYLFLSAVPVVP